MSGKWITFVQAEHTCPPPNITIESGPAGIGSVWQCECGQQWMRTKNDWEKMTGWGVTE